MQIELISNVERLHEIKPLWRNLLSLSSARDFFLLPEWFFPWWGVFGKGKDLFFVVLWENNQLCALFSLYKTKKGPFDVIAFTGFPRAARMDIILAPGCEQDSISLFSDWIFSRSDWDLLSLRNFGTFSNNPEFFVQVLRESGKKYTFATDERCCFISTNNFPGFEDYLKSEKGRNTKENIRKKDRKLRKHKQVEWDTLELIDDNIVGEMAELDSNRSSRGLKGLSFFSSPLNHLFFKNLLKELAGLDHVLLFTLRIGGILSSYLLVFKYDNKLLAYQTSFDMNFPKLSLGMQTLFRSIGYGIENGYKEYDFLSGDDLYKTRYSRTSRQNKRLQIYRGGIKSYVLYLYHAWIKPLRRRLRSYSLIKRTLPTCIRGKWDV
jgi:CelD/BcsL family acetyltransferase involved in cellulose biosynthesis